MKFPAFASMQKTIVICLFTMLGLFLIEPSALAQTVRVGWYESEYCHTDSLGRRTGLAYEYQRDIAAYTGWTYEYVPGTWSELYKMLENGEIDLLSDVSYLEDRTKHIAYSALPMGKESYYIYVRADNEDLSLDNLRSFNGKRFGVIIGSFQERLLQRWAKENGLSIEVVDIGKIAGDSYVPLLMQGDADALIAMDVYRGRENCIPIGKIGSSDYYFAVNKKRADLLSELNYALHRIQDEEPNYNQKLYEKYIASVKTDAMLSAAEKEWLAENKTIQIGCRDSYLPFCDTDGMSGEVSGMLKDYMEQAASCLNHVTLSFQTKAYQTTADSLAALKTGEVNCVFPVNIIPHDGEASGLLSTIPLQHVEVYIVAKDKEQKLFQTDRDVTVAVPEGDVNFTTFIHEFYPHWQIKTYSNDEACHKAVANREADCLLVSSYRINMEAKLRNRYQLSLIATGKNIELSFAVREEDRRLYSILNKTINLIPTTATEYALAKYSATKEKASIGEFLHDNLPTVTMAAIALLSLIALLLFQKKQAQQQAKDRQKLIMATEYDELTQLYNRNFFYEYANRMYHEQPEKHYDAIMLNIEQFHMVNDLHGRDFGDKILAALGAEIRAFLSETGGIASRAFADYFGLYCLHTEDYRQLLDRLQGTLDALSPTTNLRLRMGVMPWQEGG